MSSSHKSSRIGRTSSESSSTQNNNNSNISSNPQQQGSIGYSNSSSGKQRNDINNLSNDNKITFLNGNQTLLNDNSSTTTAGYHNNYHANATTSSIASSSTATAAAANLKSRFPRLQECAHFHYEISTIDIPKNFKAQLCIDSNDESSTATSDHHNFKQLNDDNDCTLFHVLVISNEKQWILSRTYENFRYLDKHLHSCIFDRKFSCLNEISQLDNHQFNKEQRKYYNILFAQYLNRFCEIAFINPINCGPILNWFEIDNKGNRLYATDDSPINIPAVAAAIVKKRHVAQNLDELSLDVGNMVSVIDMPSSEESVWWRGKKELEVGFFPSECVELIRNNETLSSNVADSLPKQTQSVRLKHGKLITLLRSFFNNRPTRNHLQLKGIIKQRVFGCDLGEHLSNTGKDVPELLRVCTKFIEDHGIVDGIYRHTGLQSNIQRLRNSFDEEKFSEIQQEAYLNDVHSVSSLLKMYFRELPNPLLTYQLYHKFIKSINVEQKIIEIHDLVQQLPPPHYRTLQFLMNHLHVLSKRSSETSMNTKNLAIVWAPNLLKSKEMDASVDVQYDMLYSITLQANIAEFLISNADMIFDDKFSSLNRKDGGNLAKSHRPISVCHTTGARLLSLEEAQDKYKQVGPVEVPKYHTVIDLNVKKNKKDKDIKKRKNSKSKNSNESSTGSSNSSGKVQPIAAASADIMTSSIISSKSVNAPILPSQPTITPTPPAAILIPPPQQQQPHTSSAKSFMRSLRSGSTKSTHRDINNEPSTSTATLAPVAPPVIPNDAYSSIRSSHSVQVVSNELANNNNTSSFISNKLRSSTTTLKSSIKNSPIPPPRVHTIENNRQQQQQQLDQQSELENDITAFNSLPRNLDTISKMSTNNVTGSPVLSTFKDHGTSDNKRDNLNRSNSNVSRNLLFNEQFNNNNNKPPAPVVMQQQQQLPPQNLDLDAVKKSNMQQFINYVKQQNDEPLTVPPPVGVTPTTSTTLITSTETTPSKIMLSSDLRLSTSPLSSSTTTSPSSSTSITPANELNNLVIHEDDYPVPVVASTMVNDDDGVYENLNSYDNKIYISTTSLENELNNKRVSLPVSNIRESLGFDYRSSVNIPPAAAAADGDESFKQKNISTESVIIDYETGEKFLKNSKTVDFELSKINNEIEGLMINNNNDNKPKDRDSSNSHHDHSQHDDECFYCKFNKQQQLQASLIRANSRHKSPVPVAVVLEQQQQQQQLPTTPIHVHGDGDDSNCIYCKLKKQNSPEKQKEEKEMENSSSTSGVNYRDVKNKRPQSSNAVLYDDTKLFENNNNNNNNEEIFNRKSSPAFVTTTTTTPSPPALPVTKNTTIVEVVDKSQKNQQVSSDEESVMKAKRRSTELNGVTALNNNNTTTPPTESITTTTTPPVVSTRIAPVVTPRTSITQQKSSSLPSPSPSPRPLSTTTAFIDNGNQLPNLQRSKSLAGSNVFKNTDLNKVELRNSHNTNNNSNNNRQSNNEIKHSNNSSKENIDNDSDSEAIVDSIQTQIQTTPTTTTNTDLGSNSFLNKRKCSINLDEFKRRRSEDEQQQQQQALIESNIDLQQQQQQQIHKPIRKNSYMSKSLQDNSSILNQTTTTTTGITKNVLIQQKLNQQDNADNIENGGSPINVKSKIKLMELKTNSQVSLSINSPTTPTTPTATLTNIPSAPPPTPAEQLIVRSNSLNIDSIDKIGIISQKQKSMKKNTNEINDNNISKLINLPQQQQQQQQQQQLTSLPSSSSSFNFNNRNPLANSVFIIESSTPTTATTTTTQGSTKTLLNTSNNSSIEDDYENILSKRQTVKQLKSKFESK